MDKRSSYGIIGNGITGVIAAETLRNVDASCAITIIADDPFPAYYRPALKDYLSGRLVEERLWVRPATFYRDQHIRFIPGRVVSINTQQHVVQLHNGQQVGYDKLLLANGARPRTLSCPGLDLAGVSTLRTIADYQEILRRLEHAQRVVVYGSGTLALESAEILHHRGYQVTHLMRGQKLWSEVLDPTASDLVLHEERRAGIDVRTGEEIAAIIGKHGQVSKVITASGAHIPCDLVLIAIGIEPHTSFIRASGIACGRGVKVDNGMCTSSPDVYAAGDVIETTDELTGRTRVLGQWFPAIQQAQVAAYNMSGQLTPEHPFYPGPRSAAHSAYLNYFNATFLHGLDFVSIGLTLCPSAPQYQEIIASPRPRNYRKVILHYGIIVGVLLLGDRNNALAYKRAIDHRLNLSSIADRLFSDDFNLESWLDEQQVPPPLLNIRMEGLPEPYAAQQHQSTHTVTIHTGEFASHYSLKDADAFFVPLPHPKIPVALAEIQLNTLDQASIITIGRQPGVSLLLEHSSVSRLHAEVTCGVAEILLRDQGSSNGTFVNGHQLARYTPYTLRHHDRVRFGDVQFRFELRHRVSPSSQPRADRFPHMQAIVQGTELHANASRDIPDSVLHALRTLDSTPTLILVNKGVHTQPQVIPLEHGKRYTLGRGHENVIMLDDTAASRTHSELFSTPDGFYIRDLDSRYGVFVNNTKINNAFHLTHADRIVLGNTLVYFSYPTGNTLQKVHPSTPTPEILKDKTIITRATGRRAEEGAGKHDVLPPGEGVVAGLSHRKTVRELDKERIQFEINMCIGCDRCMDACPVPMSSVVTIADLNAATITKQVARQVAQFTHECIMCGSCVPVCPVDNHRDLLMLSLKQRLGTTWNESPDMNKVSDQLPQGWTSALLMSRLREQSFLNNAQQVPDNYLLHLVTASQLRLFTPGEAVIREGEYGRDLYLILEGRLELTASTIDDTELAVAILQRGEYVGEDGMLTGLPYRASARAQRPTLVLVVPEQVLQRLMELVPIVRHHFERYGHTRSLGSILKRMALFQGVSDADLQFLIQQTPIKQYGRNERLFAADDQGGRPARETMHLLLEGIVKVARRTTDGTGQHKGEERIVAYRQGGDYFAGGLDLLGDRQAVTVTTINRCRVAEVPRHALLALFQRYPEVNQRFALRLREYVETAAATQEHGATTRSLPHFIPIANIANRAVQNGLHSLVNDGIVEGTEVLVIDLDKCIHCDECEQACERRHGHSRMNRKGMVVGNISIATACRQCQDPVCMLCSRAGIARHPNGEVYITDSCIGCGICAERCPYGAISIIPVEEERAVSSWQYFSSFFNKDTDNLRASKTSPVSSNVPNRANHVAPGPLDHARRPDGYDELRKKIAIKCDLCIGYNDQACVQACPTGAALRIQPTAFFGSAEEILRQRAN